MCSVRARAGPPCSGRAPGESELRVTGARRKCSSGAAEVSRAPLPIAFQRGGRREQPLPAVFRRGGRREQPPPAAFRRGPSAGQDQFAFAEWRISVYSHSREEWGKLARWFDWRTRSCMPLAERGGLLRTRSWCRFAGGDEWSAYTHTCIHVYIFARVQR